MAAPPPGGGSGTSTAAVVALIAVGVFGLCFVGVVAAIAIPNFMHFNTRARHAEVKSGLKEAFVAQKAYFAEKDRYSGYVEEVGFAPVAGRYLYAFELEGDRQPRGPGAAVGLHTGTLADPVRIAPLTNDQLEDGVSEALWYEVGVKGTCPACDITIVGAGNLDGDATVDVWTISTKDRTIDGVVVPAGQPHNHVDDVKE